MNFRPFAKGQISYFLAKENLRVQGLEVEVDESCYRLHPSDQEMDYNGLYVFL